MSENIVTKKVLIASTLATIKVMGEEEGNLSVYEKGIIFGMAFARDAIKTRFAMTNSLEKSLEPVTIMLDALVEKGEKS